jgi:glutamine amidotransferase
MPELAVVDYGSGNVRSMVNALKRVAPEGLTITLSADPSVLAGADRAIVPGVGAFAEVKRKLDASGLYPELAKFRDSGRPMLGVCVGMQILADKGLEFEPTLGLGWIHGVVAMLEPGQGRKLPHFGWSPVTPREGSPLFDGLTASPQFYFVHSFAFRCADPHDVEATAQYGETFTAAVRHKNLVGTQFHPEKSDTAGLGFLANFCRWSPS